MGQPRSFPVDVVVAVDGISEDSVQLGEEQLAFLVSQ